MAEPILVAVAWPYANAEIHVGNLTGAYLPADIFARFQRLKGRQVLMVSGSGATSMPIVPRFLSIILHDSPLDFSGFLGIMRLNPRKI